jgi:hypothetical protein
MGCFKVCGLKPGQGDRLLRVIKVHSTPSFRGEVKPQAPCSEIWHVKNHLQALKEILHKAKFSFLSPTPPACYQMSLLVQLQESSGGWVRSFPLLTSSFHHGSPCSYITRGMNNRPVGGLSSETWSHPIDIIIIIIKWLASWWQCTSLSVSFGIRVPKNNHTVLPHLVQEYLGTTTLCFHNHPTLHI